MQFNNIYKGKKVLVTGHTGFKGSWMSIWLNLLGAEVYGYSLSPINESDNFSICKLETLINHTIGDVRDLNSLLKYFQNVQPDMAFHFAAQPLVLKSYVDPIETFSTNLMGVVNFFEAVRNTISVKVAINVTSDKCYDNKEWIWGYRENDPMGGKDPYSASKGCAELITSSYSNSYFKDIKTCNIASVRAGNVIGGGDWAGNRIVPDFFRAFKSNIPLVIRNADSTRPWQHVLEPLSGYLQLGAYLYFNKALSGGWNFGPLSNGSFSVRDLVEAMINYIGRDKVRVVTEKNHLYEANLLRLDISKALNFLKWKPTLSFDETVKFTVDGYMSEIDDSKNILQCRERQINEYMELAKIRELL